MTITAVHTMSSCEECATVTSDPPNTFGNYYCDRHK